MDYTPQEKERLLTEQKERQIREAQQNAKYQIGNRKQRRSLEAIIRKRKKAGIEFD